MIDVLVIVIYVAVQCKLYKCPCDGRSSEVRFSKCHFYHECPSDSGSGLKFNIITAECPSNTGSCFNFNIITVEYTCNSGSRLKLSTITVECPSDSGSGLKLALCYAQWCELSQCPGHDTKLHPTE